MGMRIAEETVLADTTHISFPTASAYRQSVSIAGVARGLFSARSDRIIYRWVKVPARQGTPILPFFAHAQTLVQTAIHLAAGRFGGAAAERWALHEPGAQRGR